MGTATNLQELPTGNRAKIRPRKTDRTSLLKALRDAAVVGGIYAFFGGWAYLTYYMRFFGIPTVAVDASVYTTVVMATNLMLQPYAILAKLLCFVASRTSSSASNNRSSGFTIQRLSHRAARPIMQS
jgi:hypothetical protein